jgi:hypothetical protein
MMIPQLKSVYWTRRKLSGNGVLGIGEMTTEHALQILQWKKKTLWTDIMQLMRACPDLVCFDNTHEFNQVLTGYITEHAAICQALNQLDIRADV